MAGFRWFAICIIRQRTTTRGGSDSDKKVSVKPTETRIPGLTCVIPHSYLGRDHTVKPGIRVSVGLTVKLYSCKTDTTGIMSKGNSYPVVYKV